MPAAIDRLQAAITDRYALGRELELARTRLLLSRAYSALGDRDEAAMEERAALGIMSRIGARR